MLTKSFSRHVCGSEELQAEAVRHLSRSRAHIAGLPAANVHAKPPAQRSGGPRQKAAKAAAAAPPRRAAQQREAEEGPGTETDSDDELQPYDLSEGEDEGEFEQTLNLETFKVATMSCCLTTCPGARTEIRNEAPLHTGVSQLAC